MDTMFETLVDLPLFRGVSRDRMSKVVGTCKFHFLKYLPGTAIFREGDACQDIAFVIKGTVRMVINNPDERFSVSQSITAPDVLAPDFLFGRHTSYPGDIDAVDTVSILRISKAEYINILNSDTVFLFNYLNMLSVNAQKSLEGILAVSTGAIAERIAYWISATTQPRSHDIVMSVRSRDLTALFGVPRTSLKAALDELRARGLADYTPTTITVNDRRALIALLHNHSESPDE